MFGEDDETKGENDAGNNEGEDDVDYVLLNKNNFFIR